jgi:hypothetical protein
MTRVKRIVVSLASVLSVFLCGTTITAAVLSFYAEQVWTVGRKTSEVEARQRKITLSRGLFIFNSYTRRFEQPGVNEEQYLTVLATPLRYHSISPPHQHLIESGTWGFSRSRTTGEGRAFDYPGRMFDDSRTVSLPLWLVAAAFAVLSLIRGGRFILVRRRKRFGCKKCGYLLTGNTSGTCPECGTVIPQPSRRI